MSAITKNLGRFHDSTSSVEPTRKNPANLRFEYLHDQSPFRSLVVKYLKKSELAGCLKEKKYLCEILLEKKTPLGFVMYSKELQERFANHSKCFCVEKLSNISSSNISMDDTNIWELLMARVLKLAKRNFAENVTTTIPSDPKLLNYFQSKGFEKAKDFQKKTSSEFLCFSLEPKTGIIAIEPKDPFDCDQEISGVRSRKRSASIGSLETTERALKKSKLRHTSEPRRIETNFRNPSIREIGRVQPAAVAPPKVHDLPMKGTIYFDYIMSGDKTFEGRVHGYACKRMNKGDQLKLFDGRANWGIVCEIVSKDVYKGFREMLEAKGVLPMLPQLKQRGLKLSPQELLNEGVKIYQSFPGAQRVHQFGAVAIGVKFIKKIYNR